MASPENASTTSTSNACGGSLASEVRASPVDDGNLRSGIANIGKDIARDRLDSGIDLVELNSVAGLSIGGDCSRAEADHADLARPGIAAISDCEPHARVIRVVARRRLSLFIGAEDLCPVFDVAVRQGAQRRSRKSEVLLHTQRAVEIAHRDLGVAPM